MAKYDELLIELEKLRKKLRRLENTERKNANTFTHPLSVEKSVGLFLAYADAEKRLNEIIEKFE